MLGCEKVTGGAGVHNSHGMWINCGWTTLDNIAVLSFALVASTHWVVVSWLTLMTFCRVSANGGSVVLVDTVTLCPAIIVVSGHMDC